MNANGFEKLHGIDEMDEKQVLNFVQNGRVVDAAEAFGYNRTV